MTSNIEETVTIADEKNLAGEATPQPEKLASETNGKEVVSVEDQAAQTFASLTPIWDRFSKNATKKALVRVVKAVVNWPLQDEHPKFQTKAEFEAFRMLCMILDCKTVMISSVLEERIKKERKALSEAQTNGDTNVNEEKMA